MITLNQNEIVESISNMIISLTSEGFDDNSENSKYINENRVDGTLYGDTKIYRFYDSIGTHEWLNDAEAEKLLELDRGPEPFEFLIYIDQFRQSRITTDTVLSKRAFMTEGQFGQAIGILKEMVVQAKRNYENTVYNAFLGTVKSPVQEDVIVDVTTETTGLTGMELEVKKSLVIAEKVASTIREIGEVSRTYNDYGILRSVAKSNLQVIWNTKFVDRIAKVGMPVVYNNENLFDFKDTLNFKWFGDVNADATVGDGSTIRSMTEQIINGVRLLGGDLIPVGQTAPAGTSYTQNDNIICKIIQKGTIPFMSGFVLGSEFNNPRSHTTNNYLTFGSNTLAALPGNALVRVIEQ